MLHHQNGNHTESYQHRAYHRADTSRSCYPFADKRGYHQAHAEYPHDKNTDQQRKKSYLLIQSKPHLHQNTVLFDILYLLAYFFNLALLIHNYFCDLDILHL